MNGFPILTERKTIEKKPQNTAGNRNENPTPQGSKWPDEAIIRDITRALVLLIVFEWALLNLDAVLRFLGKALWFVLFLLVLQQVEGNLIYPKVVGKSVELPGLLVLMAVTIGGEVFGILGMLFSVPVCAVLFSLYLEFMKKASTRH
ncbi:MAG: AI-2E family transporter [Clostridiales bacterium]|nr:AI-2E family transporter [Clostridiales bacterium]